MTDDDLAQLIQLGHETRSVEFKEPGARTDRVLLAKVVRAMLAMANLRGGGVVIVGVHEADNKTLVPLGVDAESEATWLDYDAVCGAVSGFAEPSVAFDVEPRVYEGKRFVVISVEEFAEVPVICKKPNPAGLEQGASREILKAGAVYVRSRRKPESVPVPTHEDMRELIDLATEKAVWRFEVLRKKVEAQDTRQSPGTAKDAYDREAGDLL